MNEKEICNYLDWRSSELRSEQYDQSHQEVFDELNDELKKLGLKEIGDVHYEIDNSVMGFYGEVHYYMQSRPIEGRWHLFSLDLDLGEGIFVAHQGSIEDSGQTFERAAWELLFEYMDIRGEEEEIIIGMERLIEEWQLKSIGQWDGNYRMSEPELLKKGTEREEYRNHKRSSEKEKSLLDGHQNEFYKNSSQIKESSYLENGMREGTARGFYENGSLQYVSNYKYGSKSGTTIHYDQSTNVVRTSEYDNGRSYDSKEFYKDGNVRLIQENSKFSFYDKNQNLRCEIYIDDDGANHLPYSKGNLGSENCWYKWHWTRCMSDAWESRVYKKPHGVWKEFNEDGILVYDLYFGKKYDIHKSDPYNVLKTNYDSDGNAISNEWIRPMELYIERFAPHFYFSRLIDEKARFELPVREAEGWQIEEFPIPVVLKIEDILKFESAGINE